MPEAVRHALAAACEARALSREEALELTPFLPDKLRSIMAAATVSSTITAPAEPFTCGVINAKSGRCSEDCAFCAQSRYHKTDAPVYALLPKEKIYAHASRLAEGRVTRMGIVTSGAGPSRRDFAQLCETAAAIKATLDIQICVSLGVLRDDQAVCLRQAGVGSYHHNLETGRSYYPNLCTTHSYETRVDTVLRAKAAGLRVCSGGLFGLGETWDQRLELSETLRGIGVDSIPINFLMPVAGTRLQNAGPLGVVEALGIVALFRLMHPGRDIVICGGRNRTLGEWDRQVFLAGANAIMVGDYLTARGSPLERDMELVRVLAGRRGHCLPPEHFTREML